MQLRAFFDTWGRVFIARATDAEWLNQCKVGCGNKFPTLDAVNEFGGDIVTPEEIEHNFQYAEEEFSVEPYQIFYVDDEVMEYCLNFDAYAEQHDCTP